MPVQVQRRRRVLTPGAQLETARVAAAPAASVGPGANPWLPWADYGPKASPDRGGILAIIPTAANEPDRLQRCVEALQAASEGVSLRVLLVVCPANPEVMEKARMAAPGTATLALPGPFSYCDSINAGIAQLRPDEGYALFLNDDCRFATAGGLAQLKQTLITQGWACIGPWIDNRIKYEPDNARPIGPERLNRPVVGTCAFWDRFWLDRIGPLDARFSRNAWGLDEADMCMRCLRLGGLFGRDGRVVVEHDEHGTFGDAYTNYNSPAYQKSLAAWRDKYGNDCTWGGDPYWQPLPGVHVAIAGHNVAPWLDRALDSVERALAGYRWILTYADDASDDGSLAIIQAHQSSADRVLVQQFEKASCAGQAKNRALRMGMSYHDAYPAIALMDADDVMGECRFHHMLWRARDGGMLLAHGAFTHEGKQVPADLAPEVQPVADIQQLQGWIHPCSTIFHRSLIPQGGTLFPEDVPICEDALWFLQLYLAGVKSVPIPGAIVHRYCIHPDSVMYDEQGEKRAKEMLEYFSRRSRVLEEAVRK